MKAIPAVIVLLMMSIMGTAIQAANYLPDVPGTVLRFSGETRFDDESRPASLVITVLPSEVDSKTDRPVVVHEHILSILGKRKIVRKYYHVMDDGIYLIGEGEAPNLELLRFDRPQLYLPVPTRPDFSWQVDYGDSTHRIHLQCTVLEHGKGLELKDQLLKTVRILAEGISTIEKLSVPLKQTTWFEQENGVVKIIMEQTLADTVSITELALHSQKPGL